MGVTSNSWEAGPRVRRAFKLLYLIPTLLVGCQSVERFLEQTRRPSVSVEGAELSSISHKAADLRVRVGIQNPYAVPLPILDTEYRVRSGGPPFLSGKADIGQVVPANQSKSVTLPVEVPFKELLAALQQVKPGQVIPYQAEMDLSVELPGKQRLSLPVAHSGKLPIPTVPEVAIDRITWDALSWQEAKGEVALTVRNRNAFATTLENMAFKLAIGGNEIVSSELSPATELQAGEGTTLRIPIRVNPAKLGLAALSTLQAQQADYRVSGTLDLGTRYAPIRLPFDYSGKTSSSK